MVTSQESNADANAPALARAVVTKRREAMAKIAEAKKPANPDAMFIHRCAQCEGIGIVYMPGVNPIGEAIKPHHWVATYREDPSQPWYKREIYCQECNSRGTKTALRLTYDDAQEGFVMTGRLTRFVEEFDQKTGRFTRHVEAERKENEAKQRELLLMSQIQGVIQKAVRR